MRLLSELSEDLPDEDSFDGLMDALPLKVRGKVLAALRGEVAPEHERTSYEQRLERARAELTVLPLPAPRVYYIDPSEPDRRPSASS